MADPNQQGLKPTSSQVLIDTGSEVITHTCPDKGNAQFEERYLLLYYVKGTDPTGDWYNSNIDKSHYVHDVSHHASPFLNAFAAQSDASDDYDPTQYRISDGRTVKEAMKGLDTGTTVYTVDQLRSDKLSFGDLLDNYGGKTLTILWKPAPAKYAKSNLLSSGRSIRTPYTKAGSSYSINDSDGENGDIIFVMKGATQNVSTN